MANINYSDYIHEYTSEKTGDTLYAVCVWDEFHGQWQEPMDAEECKLTGCHTYYAKTLTGIGGYKSRRTARREARKRFNLLGEV